MSNYSDKVGQTCSRTSDCFPYGWCGGGRCQQTCVLNSQTRRGYYCICNEGGSNQNCPQGTSCQGNVCKPYTCPEGYANAKEGPIFFLQPGNNYTTPILNNQQPRSLQSWYVDRQISDKNYASRNKVAQQIQDFVYEYLKDKKNGTTFCSLFVSGGGNSRLGRLGGYKNNDTTYSYQMTYGTGQTTQGFSFNTLPNFKNTNSITLESNADNIYQVREIERLKQQIASNQISIDTYNRKIDEIKQGIIIKRADAERKERLLETQNRQVFGQSKDLENKINLLQTRKAMLDYSIEKNNFKNKQIYTQISGICAVLIIMILLYVFFNKFYQS